MEDFKRKRVKQIERPIDSYEAQLKRTSKNSLKTAELAFEKSSGTVSDERIMKQRVLYILQNYGIAAFAIVNTALWYPLSVRLVKRVFRLRGFLNIHFAIIPIVGHANALAVGCLQGWLNGYKFRRNYPLPGENSHKAFL